MKSLTIIFPIHPRETEIQKRILDLESFFSKWPLVTDLLFVLEPGSEAIRRHLEGLKHDKIKSHFIENLTHLGRARSLQKGLASATGELVILGSFDLSIPMAEYFNLIHEAISVPDASIFKGNRFSSRKKQSGLRAPWHRVLEDIVLEKWRKGRFSTWSSHRSGDSQAVAAMLEKISDPLCNLYAVRQPLVERLRADRPLSQWYYGLDLLKWASNHNLKIVEIPVINSVDQHSKIPLFREFFRHGF